MTKMPMSCNLLTNVLFLFAVAFGHFFGNQWLMADEFPPIYNSEPAIDANPLEPVLAAEGFSLLPEGVLATVFAAEPDVQNPIAMTWDSRGRLWVAENYTYAERTQRFDLGLRDRVVIFHDLDGDGIHDQRTVFTDQVQMLTSIELGHGSVWLMCPPRLLRIPDSNLDGIPDGPAEVVLDGFDVAAENYHNFANGLRWGPDGWLYGRCGGSCPGLVGVPGSLPADRIPLEGGIWRYHVQQKRFEVLCHGTTNPWGHDWNEWGECFFINTVNGHLWHLIPGAHFDRPFTLDPNPFVYELLDMHADHWHFDTKGQWFLSRDGSADRFGGGHAHVGMMIYLGNQWPAEYHGRLFTWNIHGRRANQELIERSGSGYVARHRQDILQSNDPFFRGMELTYGPDGSVYAIDWSDTGECHEHTGVHRTSGRIFRFAVPRTTADDSVRSVTPIRFDLRDMPSRQLVDLHAQGNEWFVRQSRLILAERAAAERNLSKDDSSRSWRQDLTEAVERLRSNLNGTDDLVACRSLLTLSSMETVTEEVLERCFSHPNEHLRTWTVRLLLDQHPIDSVFSQCQHRRALPEQRLRQLVSMAQADPSGLVRLSLASALQRMPLDARIPLADALMSRVEDAEDHNLPLMVWYGIIPVVESNPVSVADIAVSSTWPKTQQLMARRIASLKEESPEALERLLQGCFDASPMTRLALLSGIAQGLKGWRSTAQPASWSLLTQRLKDLDAENPDAQELNAVVQELSVLFGEGRVLDQVRKVVCDETVEVSLRRSALESLVAGRPEGVVEICLELLDDARLNAVALGGLVGSSDPDIATALLKNYFRFRSPDRPSVIALLATRAQWAKALLQAVERGRIPKEHLTAYDVRQMVALNNEEITKQLESLWGKLRTTPEDKKKRMEEIKSIILTANVTLENAQNGRKLFDRQCALCHRMFGSGQNIGPDLTGGNRQESDYLVENIVDPSAIVSKDYRTSMIVTVDGRTLSGLVITRSDKILEMQTQTERITLPIAEIEQISQTALSPMPDGLLDNLSRQEIIDLMAYLRHPTQVALPEE